MSKHKIKIYKTVTVEAEADVEEELEVSNSEIFEALKYHPELDNMLDACGFISFQNLGIDQITLLDKMKLELIGDLLKNATLNQLEEFRRNL